MPNLKETLAPPQDNDAVEIDEVWSFVRRKSRQAWVWIALSYQTRQVLAMTIGDRSAKTGKKLWDKLPEAYQKLLTFTDFLKSYLKVIPRELHQRCPKSSGLTNSVERFNLTLRQRLGRMVRKTLSFSRSWTMHVLCLRLFIDTYNRECIQRFKLKTT